MLIDSSSNVRRGRNSRHRSRDRDSSTDSTDSTVQHNKHSRQYRRTKRRRIESSSEKTSSYSSQSESSNTSSTEYENPHQPQSVSTSENQDPSQTASTSTTTLPTDSQDPRINILGRRLTVENPLGPPIEENIAVRWREVLRNGLPKEEQLELINKYTTPENCKNINAPVLNSEIKVAIHQGAMDRDNRMVSKQQKMAACLSALGQSMTEIWKNPGVDNGDKVLEIISDASRILLEVQREESLTRKALIVNNLNTSMADTLKATNIGEFLFGEELDDQIKTKKAIERTSKELRAAEKPATKVSKNFKRPSRPNAPKSRFGTGGQYKKRWTQKPNSHQNANWKNQNTKRPNQGYRRR